MPFPTAIRETRQLFDSVVFYRADGGADGPNGNAGHVSTWDEAAVPGWSLQRRLSAEAVFGDHDAVVVRRWWAGPDLILICRSPSRLGDRLMLWAFGFGRLPRCRLTISYSPDRTAIDDEFGAVDRPGAI